MKIGYIRVSTEEQNTVRQEVLLHGLYVDEGYIDKASGKGSLSLRDRKIHRAQTTAPAGQF